MIGIRIGIASALVALAAPPALADDPPRGEVTKYVFENSKVFPGTTRDYWVYVPKRYDPDKPACLYVNQDGIQYKAPAVFDELIHEGAMPVTIGVFVMHGRVKATREDALDRFNRSYEYDGLGPDYARFLIDELLPAVEAGKTNDGRQIRLSRDPNDRAIGGGSSGAIAAFTAAWERPDSFRRVFSSIGTYVGLRGGNEYPTLIRKTEPKPLRVFLEDGENDLNIYGGDWWMANQEMERALTFAGYEVEHSWGKGGHDGKHATEVFPDAMRWLWKDHPRPVKAGLGSPQLQEILIPGEDWQVVQDDSRALSTRLVVNAKGEVLIEAFRAGGRRFIGLDGRIAPLPEFPGSGGEQLNAIGPGGRLLFLDEEGVVALDEQGKREVVARGVGGLRLAVRHDGNLYVPQSSFYRNQSQVWHVGPGGETRIVDKGLKDASGIAFSPDQSLLYIADGRSHWVYSYQVADDGSLLDKQQYFRLHVPDFADDADTGELRVDRDGRLYAATNLGLQVCDQAGRVNAILPSPGGRILSFAFGGEAFDIVYVSCGRQIYKRKVKVKGANSFEPPIKPAPPRL